MYLLSLVRENRRESELMLEHFFRNSGNEDIPVARSRNEVTREKQGFCRKVIRTKQVKKAMTVSDLRMYISNDRRRSCVRFSSLDNA
jgi:hypothetical protein